MREKTSTHSKRTIYIVFSTVVGSLVLMLLLSSYVLNNSRKQIDTLIFVHDQKSRLVNQMHRLARERTLSLQSMLLLDDPARLQDEWTKFTNIANAYSKARNALHDMDLTADEKALFAQHDELLEHNHDAQHRVVRLLQENDYRQVRQVLLSTILPVQDQVIQTTEKLAITDQVNASHDIDTARASYNRIMQFMIILSLLALGILAGVALFIIRRLHKSELDNSLTKERSSIAFNSIAEAVFTTDTAGNIDQMNKAAEELLGKAQHTLYGLPLNHFMTIRSPHFKTLHDVISKVCESGEAMLLDNTTHLIIQNREELAIEISVAPIFDSHRALSGVVLVIKDVSEMQALTTELAHQAMHDSLTGLLNRREFENRLEQTITEIRRYSDEQAWFCYLDLDQFKIINDTCGHLAGDELLKQIAYKLISVTREVDHIGRVGGDEFSIILKRCERDMAHKIMDRVRNEIHDMRFCWDNKCFTVSVSIGIVEINARCGTVYDVLKAADTACYIAKEEGRNRIHLYDEDDQKSSQRQGEMEWVHRIYRAIETGHFVLFFQEIKSLKQNAPGIHGELLVRMLDDDCNIISPYAFIPAAERYNLMPEVDRHIVHLALNSISNYYHNPQVSNGIFAINLSAQSLSDDTFLDFVLTQLANSKVQPGNICFEITETAAISNLVKATKFIKTLKEKGCYFALDDFGSGLSSFAYLKNLPVDFLKIDGGFVKGMLSDSLDYALVSAVNQIGHVVGIDTIAEFVETSDIQETLSLMGVDYGQGYGIGRPEPFETLLNRLAAGYRANHAG